MTVATNVTTHVGTNVTTDVTDAVAEALIYALGGFDGATSLGSAAGAAVPGSAATGLGLIIFFRYDGMPSATERFVRTLSGTSGYLISLSNTGVITAQTGNGTVAASAPTKTMVAGDIGKIHGLCLSHDLSNVFMYFDRVQLGVSTAQSGYNPSLGDRMTVGSTAGGASPLTKAQIVGIAGRNSPISLADFQTVCDATKAAGRLELGGVSMTHRYSAEGGTVAASILDTIGTDHLSFQLGTAANLEIVTVANSWGF